MPCQGIPWRLPSRYSTTNFVVGEFILEAVTGQTIQTVIQDLVFAPFGLENMELPDRFSDGVLPDPCRHALHGTLMLGRIFRLWFEWWL
jgi:CubicO group peptidase (beta-lactamase class C family)